jgi:hypothetical protein
MIGATVAKFRCYSVEDFGPSQRIKMTTVYESPLGDNEENRRFYKASPSGQFEITVDNPNVHGFFVKDRDYIMEIRPAQAGETSE